MVEPNGRASAVTASSPENTDQLAEQIGEASRDLELRDPDAGSPLMDRLINRGAEIVGVTVLVMIVAVIFANAVSRYVFSYSFIWAEELVQMSMPWLAMIGVFLAVRRGTVIRIDFFFERLPARLQGSVASFGYMLSIMVLLFMGWVCLDFVRLFGSDVALYVEVPTGWSTVSLVFGAFGAALAYVVEFWRELRRRQKAAASAQDTAS